MVGAHFQGLIPPHHQPSLAILTVLEQPYIASATLFPFPALAIEPEQFRPHLEGLFLLFLVRLDFNLLGKVDDRLEMDIGFSFGIVL